MTQKILAARASDPSLRGDLVEVKVDQIVLARAPMRGLAEGVLAGLKRATAEVAIAYETVCVSDATTPPAVVQSEALARGLLVARPGAGFPGPVHLERFASPARLCVTDEPRLAGVGGAGMLSLVVAPGQIGQALAQGTVWVRPPRSIQVSLSGRMRPFVCARDVALELLRRGLGDAVRRVEAEHKAPVVIELTGPTARLLSVAERAVLCAIAPQLGAVAAIFVGDERTEVFLRDQRRSKAHRALAPDAGAPCDDVMSLDLASVDPLLLDEAGQVRPVRDLAGTPVAQVLLGGDGGVSLRDLFAAAALLKSKRVPAGVELLFAPPSRQSLETLAQAGALTDLIATGARIVEPDARLVRGQLHLPPEGGLGARTCDRDWTTRPGDGAPRAIVASAETLAYAVATGEIGDPRSFKRPVRVTVPRALPTDDVLIARDRGRGEAKKEPAAIPMAAPAAYKGGPADVVDAAGFLATAPNGKMLAVVCTTLDDVREVASRAADHVPSLRAVLAPFIPSGTVALLSGLGVAAIEIEASAAKGLGRGKPLALPAPNEWSAAGAATVAHAGAKLPLTWLARGVERTWASAGTARPAAKSPVRPR